MPTRGSRKPARTRRSDGGNDAAIAVAIVEDNYYAALSLRLLVYRDKRTRVRSCCGRLDEFIAGLAQPGNLGAPDLLVMGVSGSGTELAALLPQIKSLKQIYPDMRIVVGVDRPNDLPFADINNVLDGIVCKSECGNALVSLLCRCFEPGMLVTPSVAKAALTEEGSELRYHLNVAPPAVPIVQDPSTRDRVAEMYCIFGLSASEISRELDISISTVQWHIKMLYQLLGVSNRRDAHEALLRGSTA